MHDDERRLAERLRRYESRIPVEAETPAVVRTGRVPMWALGAVAVALIGVAVLAANLVADDRQVGDVSPSPSATAAPTTPPSGGRPDAGLITAVELQDAGRGLFLVFGGYMESCTGYEAETNVAGDVLEVLVTPTEEAISCRLALVERTLLVELDPPFTGTQVRDIATGELFSVGVATATATPTPVETATPQPLPPMQEVHVVNPGRFTALVHGIQPLGDGQLVAVVNTSSWESMPATGPHGMTGSIHIGSAAGGWQLVDTGDIFSGVEFKALFKAPDGRLVAYGDFEGFDETIGVGFASSDGLTWEQYDLPWSSSSSWDTMLTGGQLGYLAVVSAPNPETHLGRFRAFLSTDAETWTLVYESPEAEDQSAFSAGVGSEGFVIAATDTADNTPFTIASADGITWITSSDDQPFNADRTSLYALSAFGPDWVAVGFPNAEANGIPVYLSANGLDWTHAATIDDPGAREYFGYPAHLVATDHRLFLSAAFLAEGTESRPAGTWTSTDGRTWSMLPIGDTTEVRTVATFGNRVVFGGRQDTFTPEDPGASGIIWSADEAWFP